MTKVSVAIATVIVLGCGGTAEGNLSTGEVAVEAAALSPGVQQQLAAVRRATARYHDVQNALDDHYVPLSACESSPDGAMGFHYVNVDRMLDPALDVEAPEALLYVPSGNGLRLAGVEYISLIVTEAGPYMGCGANDNSCPPANPPPAPELFAGHPFDGPMAGHNPQMPWHFDQHVWVWAPNPDGMFARWNPSLSCGDAVE